MSTNSTPLLSDTDRAARRARLLANLEMAVQLAEQLGKQIINALPRAAGEVRAALDPTLSVDERIRLGDSAACELTAIALQLAPEETLDSLESNLDHDRGAERETVSLIARLKNDSR